MFNSRMNLRFNSRPHTRSPRSALVALVVIGAVGLAACGSDGGDETPDATTAGDDEAAGAVPTTDQLSNRAFESTSVTGHELVEGTTISLLFEADSLSMNAGCNTMFGGYTFDEDALMVEQLAMTQMACDPALMDQDTWLSEFLNGLPKAAYEGTTLTLTGADATVTFDEIADAPIEGTTWVVTGTVANEAVASVPAGAEATLTITDGSAAIASGCNTGSGDVEVTETTLTFGPVATTRMACADDLMALEASVLGVLDGTVDYQIHGDSLLITSTSGDGLQFTAQS